MERLKVGGGQARLPSLGNEVGVSMRVGLGGITGAFVQFGGAVGGMLSSLGGHFSSAWEGGWWWWW